MLKRYFEWGLIIFVWFVFILGVLARRNNRPFKPKDLIIVSIEAEPYLMRTPNGGYRGYIKDVLDRIMSLIDARYSIYIVPDNQYGYMESGRKWNGMIKEILDNNADIAAAPLHRTYPRARVVDFTLSIMNVSATMVVKKPEPGQTLEIKSLEDLRSNPKIQFGTLETSTIVRDFKNSNSSFYQELWGRMNSFRPNPFTTSNAEGLQRVRASNGYYAYIMPSDIAEYTAGKSPCDLLTLERFFQREFSFATEKGSPLLPSLNKVIHELNYSGFMYKLYRKWWQDSRPCQDFTYPEYQTNGQKHTRQASVSSAYGHLQYSLALLLLNSVIVYNVFIFL